jgi:DNA-binding beta-propeller fold protein YncE
MLSLAVPGPRSARRPLRLPPAVAVLAAALLAVPAPAPAGAATAAKAPSPGGVVYVTNGFSGDVSSLAIGADGALTPLGRPVSTGGCTDDGTTVRGKGCTPRGIALTPDGLTAYVVNSDSDTLSAFRVGARGALLPQPRIVPTGDEPWGVTVAPGGRTLYVTDTADATVSAYRIGPDGTPVRFGAFRTTSDHPKVTVLSPDGRFLYLSYADTEETADSPSRPVTRFAVRPDGSLGPATDVARVAPADFGMTMSPDGRLLYVTSNAGRNVAGFRRGADGSLTPVPRSPFFVPDPVGLRVTPDGRHLYVGGMDDTGSPPGGLLGFTILADGSLTPTADSPGRTPGTAEVDAVAVTPDGRNVFAAIRDTSQVVGFGIGPGGTLTQAPGSPFDTGGERPLSQSLAVRPVPVTTTG